MGPKLKIISATRPLKPSQIVRALAHWPHLNAQEIQSRIRRLPWVLPPLAAEKDIHHLKGLLESLGCKVEIVFEDFQVMEKDEAASAASMRPALTMVDSDDGDSETPHNHTEGQTDRVSDREIKPMPVEVSEPVTREIGRGYSLDEEDPQAPQMNAPKKDSRRRRMLAGWLTVIVLIALLALIGQRTLPQSPAKSVGSSTHASKALPQAASGSATANSSELDERFRALSSWDSESNSAGPSTTAAQATEGPGKISEVAQNPRLVDKGSGASASISAPQALKDMAKRLGGELGGFRESGDRVALLLKIQAMKPEHVYQRGYFIWKAVEKMHREKAMTADIITDDGMYYRFNVPAGVVIESPEDLLPHFQGSMRMQTAEKP